MNLNRARSFTVRVTDNDILLPPWIGVQFPAFEQAFITLTVARSRLLIFVRRDCVFIHRRHLHYKREEARL